MDQNETLIDNHPTYTPLDRDPPSRPCCTLQRITCNILSTGTLAFIIIQAILFYYGVDILNILFGPHYARILPSEVTDFETYPICGFNEANYRFAWGWGMATFIVLQTGVFVMYFVIALVWCVLSYLNIHCLNTSFARWDISPPLLKEIHEVPSLLTQRPKSSGGVVLVMCAVLLSYLLFNQLGFGYANRYDRVEIPLAREYQIPDPELNFWIKLDDCTGVDVGCKEGSLYNEQYGQVVLTVPKEGVDISLGSSIQRFGASASISVFETDTGFEACDMRKHQPLPEYRNVDLISLNDNYYYQQFVNTFYCSNVSDSGCILSCTVINPVWFPPVHPMITRMFHMIFWWILRQRKT
eukprot:TRINITY_DN4494_c0_g1_i1.p1 TRINITY_DN4494_c0_g1~~TRINITY_DN4494_c0_g1_i1.p1  ORF type:complete len:368 (+),score=36.35 TRINITY_DN4494_c0_g1_i1:43-1104(+)